MPLWKNALVGFCVGLAAGGAGIDGLGWKWALFCLPLDIALIVVGER